MSDLPSQLIGKTLGNRYQLLRKIGSGAMGGVYEAKHTVLGRRLAVKVLDQRCSDPNVRERFFYEAQAAATIEHEHVVQVVDFGLLEGQADQPYIVMEYVDGQTLDSYIERHAPLTVADAAEVTAQLLSALAVVHGAGLIHRDVKPANVMLARGRRQKLFAKIVDFGISRALNPAWQRPDLTAVDQILGTPAYLAPEQAVGGEPDPGWDLWAVAIVLYEMLTGDLPYELRTVAQVTRDIAACKLIPLARRRQDLPAWVYQLFERATNRERQQRFSTATAFLEALERRNAWPTINTDNQGRTVPFMRVPAHRPPADLMGHLMGDRPAAPNVGEVTADSPTVIDAGPPIGGERTEAPPRSARRHRPSRQRPLPQAADLAPIAGSAFAPRPAAAAPQVDEGPTVIAPPADMPIADERLTATPQPGRARTDRLAIPNQPWSRWALLTMLGAALLVLISGLLVYLLLR